MRQSPRLGAADQADRPLLATLGRVLGLCMLVTAVALVLLWTTLAVQE